MVHINSRVSLLVLSGKDLGGSYLYNVAPFHSEIFLNCSIVIMGNQECIFHVEQVTRGHNIVADGWAGASNPQPYPNPYPTLKLTQKVSKTLVFPLFNSIITDGPTDGRTDGPTDGQSLL